MSEDFHGAAMAAWRARERAWRGESRAAAHARVLAELGAAARTRRRTAATAAARALGARLRSDLPRSNCARRRSACCKRARRGYRRARSAPMPRPAPRRSRCSPSRRGSTAQLAHRAAGGAALDGRVPAMRKDFLVDPYQVYEARAAGAGGVLIILRMLAGAMSCWRCSRPPASSGCSCCSRPSMRPICELAGALVRVRMRARCQLLVGVNCRDLTTLQGGAGPARALAPGPARGVPCVAESGVSDVRPMRRGWLAAGYELALVGSALMHAPDPMALTRSLLAAGDAAAQALAQARTEIIPPRRSAHVDKDLRHDERRGGERGARGRCRCRSVSCSRLRCAQLEPASAGAARGAGARPRALIAVTLHPTQALIDQILRELQARCPADRSRGSSSGCACRRRCARCRCCAPGLPGARRPPRRLLFEGAAQRQRTQWPTGSTRHGSPARANLILAGGL